MLALEAGYVTNRAERTFNERMVILRDLGLVRTQRLGLREHGFVLLLDPHQIIVAMREKDPKRIPERWWTAFLARCNAVGIRLPGDAVTAATDAVIAAEAAAVSAFPWVGTAPGTTT